MKAAENWHLGQDGKSSPLHFCLFIVIATHTDLTALKTFFS